MTSNTLPPDTSTPVPESNRSIGSILAIGCGSFLVICVALFIWGSIRDSSTTTTKKVELSGSVTLWGAASTNPKFSETCGGTGEYAFINRNTKIKITSGDKVNYEGVLAKGRGGESGECDFPFSGKLIVSDGYTIELTGSGESLSTACRANQVPVYDRGTIGDIAFMGLRITENGFSCETKRV